MWNMFSIEVAQEKQIISQLGLKEYMNQFWKSGEAYKRQALRELSLRLYLQEELAEMEKRNLKLIDRIEELT